MAITDLDGVIAGLATKFQTALIVKASLGNQLAGGYTSLWRSTGIPTQGAIPSTAAIPDKATVGALFDFDDPTGGDSVYMARSFLVASVTGTDVQFVDRLSHMGGLSGTATGSQTVDCDVSTLAGTRCRSDYANVQWWIEIYTDIGTTGQTATITYTNAAGTPSQTTTMTIGGTSPANRASRLFPIIPANGESIESIQSIQHASTGTVGSYGITATRLLSNVSLGLANAGEVYDWAQLGLPEIPDDACIAMITIPGNATIGTLNGNVKLIRG